MNIVIPHAGPLAQEVRDAVDPLEPWYADVSGAEDAYWELLRRIWMHGERFVVVEHDIVPWEGAVEAIWDCPEPWCSYTYLIHGRLQAALGCTKFGEDAIGKVPHVFDLHADHSWRHQDSLLHLGLVAHGFMMHVHEPPVRHLNKLHEHPPVTSGVYTDGADFMAIAREGIELAALFDIDGTLNPALIGLSMGPGSSARLMKFERVKDGWVLGLWLVEGDDGRTGACQVVMPEATIARLQQQAWLRGGDGDPSTLITCPMSVRFRPQLHEGA